jgi:hypothetical protein
MRSRSRVSSGLADSVVRFRRQRTGTVYIGPKWERGWCGCGGGVERRVAGDQCCSSKVEMPLLTWRLVY